MSVPIGRLALVLVAMTTWLAAATAAHAASATLLRTNCQPVGFTAGGELVFNEKEANGLWDVRVGATDCSGGRALMASWDGNRGATDVSADGRYALVETATGVLRKSDVSAPGAGYANDIQLVDLASGQVRTLVTKRMGTIWARFNPSATKLVWSQMVRGADLWHRYLGAWELHVADITATGLANERSWQHPTERYVASTDTGGNFIEPYGWLPGTDKIVFASDAGVRSSIMWWLGTQLWSMPDSLPAGDTRTRISPGFKTWWGGTENAYHEFAAFHDGWLYTSINRDAAKSGMDLWRMRYDGSQRERVTWFGGQPSGSSSFAQVAGFPTPRYVVVGGLTFAPDGSILAGVATDPHAANIDAYVVRTGDAPAAAAPAAPTATAATATGSATVATPFGPAATPAKKAPASSKPAKTVRVRGASAKVRHRAARRARQRARARAKHRRAARARRSHR